MKIWSYDMWWYLVDLLFPCAQPLSKVELDGERARLAGEKEEWNKRIAALPHEEDALNEYMGECSKLLEGEEGRRQSVDTRLTSIMGLCSIAGTIVFGSIFAQATGTLRAQATWLRWILAFGAMYLTIQLCAAILAAVRGISRKAWESVTVTDILPSPDEDRAAYLRRRIAACRETLADHRSKNNEKVTQMAVAHRAMKNFLWGLLLLALCGVSYGVTTSHEDDLVETLKRNHRLYEMLRGPQGLPGPTGPKGEPGLSGTKCTRGMLKAPSTK